LLQKISKDIWVVYPPAQPRFPYGNCLYVGGEAPIVIDAGAGKMALTEVIPSRVSTVLLSHSHYDHIHSTYLFPHADIMVGWQEESCYASEKNWIESNGYKNWDEMLQVARVISLIDNHSPGDVPFRPHFKPLALAGTFSDLQVLDSGALKVTILHLPGHTAGHYGFYIEAEGVLFSSDMDLAKTGPWMGDATSDIDQLICSIKRLKEINPRIIVPSHRRVQTSDLNKQLDAFWGVVLKRQERILELLKIPHTIEQLADYHMFYTEPRIEKQLHWERMIMKTHITYSLRHGLIKEVSPGLYQRI
jgi:ribonuclease/clavin/mitogillin